MRALTLPFTISPAPASPPSSATLSPPASAAAAAHSSPAGSSSTGGSPAGQLGQKAWGSSDSPVLFVHRPGASGATQPLEHRGRRVTAELQEEEAGTDSIPRPQDAAAPPAQPPAQPPARPARQPRRRPRQKPPRAAREHSPQAGCCGLCPWLARPAPQH
uniref:Uncharacterized protein n=2 Tax=Pipistrellus kuhlii TaxID=59472 RepID=A0A7J7R887_PIPKU|nr:hypothetical protein mPipKuh1_006553 [Pipistrellus kuhlii]